MKRGHKYTLAYNTRYASPFDNLLYAILLQAVADNDIEYLKSDDARAIWKHLKKAKRSE